MLIVSIYFAVTVYGECEINASWPICYNNNTIFAQVLRAWIQALRRVFCRVHKHGFDALADICRSTGGKRWILLYSKLSFNPAIRAVNKTSPVWKSELTASRFYHKWIFFKNIETFSRLGLKHNKLTCPWNIWLIKSFGVYVKNKSLQSAHVIIMWANSDWLYLHCVWFKPYLVQSLQYSDMI